MTAFAAWREGIRRVNRAPAVLAGVWAMTMIVSLPLALELRGAIQQHLGSSLEADEAASGVNDDWIQEFSAQATGVGATFGPTVIGFGAALDNISRFIDRDPQPEWLVATAALYLAAWLFVAGGVIDRYARDRATRAQGFFAAGGAFFFRFLRLGLLAAAMYTLLFAWVHPWLFDEIYPAATANLTVERTAFLVRLALYLLFGTMVAAANLLFDYAKVRAVVEDRRSALGALGAAARFVGRNAAAASALFGLDALLFLAVLGLYAAVAPGAGGAGVSMWTAFVVGQLYVAARLWVKLVFWASEAALFQGRLAHARYVAAPSPVWPDSPAAEALRQANRE
jgi:hypothetical protein